MFLEWIWYWQSLLSFYSGVFPISI